MNHNAKLTFPNRELATQFGIEWSRFSMRGRDTSSTKENGSVEVKIYNVSDDEKKWVDEWIKKHST